jgi:hypothetical protein
MERFALVCVLSLLVSAASANLVVNSGFESMSGNPLMPDGWLTYTGTGATVYYAAKTDVVYEGDYSFKIAARNGYGMIHQTIGGFSGGQSLSLWLYGRGDTNADWQMDEPGDKVDVSIKFLNSGGGQIGSEISMVLFDANPDTEAEILSTTEWLKSPVFNFITPENTASVQIKIRSVDGTPDGNQRDGTGVHLDNITLIPEPGTMVLLGLGGLVGVLRRKP